jgi:hypothetical protein
MIGGTNSLITLLLNLMLLLAAASLAGVAASKHAHGGPEGPVGAWLLAVPYFLLTAGAAVALVARGAFDWIPGGKAAGFLMWGGLVLALAAASYYALEDLSPPYAALGMAFGWLLLLGCFLAVNLPGFKDAVAVTLGAGCVLGWMHVALWTGMWVSSENQRAEQAIAGEHEFQDRRDAEFLALGKDAPLWNYFGYMYIENEALRKQCREIIASRPDRDERLVEYLSSEILMNDATRYIANLHPSPGTALAAGYANFLERRLAEFSDYNPGKEPLGERSLKDIEEILKAALRIRRGAGDVLTPQLQTWRVYLQRFANAPALVKEIDQEFAAASRANHH